MPQAIAVTVWIALMDVGQTIVVREQAVVAVEAMEDVSILAQPVDLGGQIGRAHV